MSITVEEALEQKIKLENEMGKLVRDFEKETKLRVVNASFMDVIQGGVELPIDKEVIITVEL